MGCCSTTAFWESTSTRPGCTSSGSHFSWACGPASTTTSASFGMRFAADRPTARDQRVRRGAVEARQNVIDLPSAYGHRRLMGQVYTARLHEFLSCSE